MAGEESSRILKVSASRVVVAAERRGAPVVVKRRFRRGWRRLGALGLLFLRLRIRRVRREGVRLPRCVGLAVSPLGGWTELALEALPGVTLDRYLANHRPGLATRRRLARRLGLLLGRLHRAGYRHRDLKAPNVLVDERLRPWLLDPEGLRLRRGELRAGLRRDLARLRRDLARLGGTTFGEARAFLVGWRRATGVA